MRLQDLRRLLADSLDMEQFQVEGLVDRLIPVLVVEDLTPVGTSLGRWAVGEGSKAAVAGEMSRIHLQNPVGSGMQIEVHDIHIACQGTSAIFVGWSEAQLATAEAESLGNRYLGTVAGPGATVGIITSDSDPVSGIAAGDGIWNQLVTGSQGRTISYGGKIVLRPGTGIRVVSAANITLYASWLWREITETRT